MSFGGRVRGVWALAAMASVAVAQQIPVPSTDAALRARVVNSYEAWHAATTPEARAAVRQKLGPFDAELLDIVSGWGEDYQKSGDLPGAIERLHFCAEESEIAGVPLRASVCWQLIGGTERLQGKYQEAEAHYRTALEFARKTGAEVRIPLVLNNLAGVYFSEGRYGDGIDMLYQALDYNKKHDIADDAAPYQNLAIAFAMRGDNVRSLENFTIALGMYEKEGFTKKLGLTHYNIGILQMKQTNYEAAVRELELSRGLSEKSGDKLQLALTLGDYGLTQDLSGHPAEALGNIQKAVALSREQGFKPAYVDAQMNLGNFYLRHEDLSKAKLSFGEALGVARNELHDPNNTGLALRGLAFVAYREKDFTRALDLSAESRKAAREVGDTTAEWRATALLAMGLRASGKIDQARATFAEAIGLVEKQRGAVAGGDVERQRFFEAAVYPYRELAALEIDAGNGTAALVAAERARARVLLDVLSGNPEEVTDLMTDEERATEKRMKASITLVNARLARAKPASLAAIGKERDNTWQDYETFLQQLYARHPQLQRLRGDSPPPSADDLARLVAAPGTAIVEFLCEQNELLLFVVTAGKDPRKPQVSAHRIGIGRADVAKRAEKYRAMLEARDPAFRTESRALYTLLLGPAAAELRGKTKVRIVPDGPLWSLPFQALTDGSGRYWIETTAISWIHSITFLRDQAAGSARGSAPRQKELLVLGVPELADQARRIAALYNPANEVVLTGAAASEASLKNALPGARVVHLAAHGVVDPVNGLHSRLLLPTAGQGSGNAEDGWLEAWELMRTKMSADLVVLSACETGRGKAADGEGLLGLTWALFVSGARSAVVSQWRVESESTTELMVGLHERLRQGAAGDEALRGSVLALMKNPAYRHPMYWAPFIYSGR